jgi:uncharacterized repeat protein (TIGR03803 family)
LGNPALLTDIEDKCVKIRLNRIVLLVIPTLAVFILIPFLHAQTYSVLYNFGAATGDPTGPYLGVLAQGRDGSLYGTTPTGGTLGYGTVFKVTPNGKLTVLHSFDSTHGQEPFGGLTLGTDGNFYGTTWSGGTYEVGNIFKITPSGDLTVLYSFTGQSDGGNPYAAPIEGADGNYYGTTWYDAAQGCGTVYKMTPAGSLTTFRTFGHTDGCSPIAPLVQVNDGSFYGTTQIGGRGNFGEVFRITTSGALATVGFDNTDGGDPYSAVIQASDGNLYGTAAGWGGLGWGTIYKVTRNGTLVDLYDFNGQTDSGGPVAGLVQATDGNLYGVASGGGFNNDNGTIYSLNHQGIFSPVHTFDGTSGSDPNVNMLQHTNGLFYGDTTQGGAYADGVFYSFDLGLKPFVSVLPPAGKIGKTIEILGQGFTGATAVSFNGVPAKFKVIEDTFLRAIVPKGARTGFLKVMTPNGTLTSNRQFIVIP